MSYIIGSQQSVVKCSIYLNYLIVQLLKLSHFKKSELKFQNGTQELLR